MTDDVIARAKTACDRWSRTPGVTIEVWDGLVDAEDDYRNAPQLVADLISLAESQAAEIQRLHSWDGLMSILDGHYRESVFPTEADNPDRDPGPRIISLIRNLDRRTKQLAAIREINSLKLPGMQVLDDILAILDGTTE